MTADASGAGADPIEVYTDGACSGNPGPGGWAWAVADGPSASGGEPVTTNQRMELKAVLEALQALSGPVTVFSDSTYVVNCFNDRWFEGWLKRDWRNAQKKPVANRDLWEPLVDLFLRRRDELAFVWVKGHSGDAMNELVDQLAVAETEKQKAAMAAEAAAPVDPADIGPPPPWPVDSAIAVTGVRDLDRDRRSALAEAVAGLDPGHDVLISGLRRGAELEGAELAVKHGIPLGVVLPYDDPAVRWARALRLRFDRCVESARWTVTLDGDPASPSKAVKGRNDWMWGSVVGAVTVGDPELTGRLDELGLGVIEID